MLKMNDKKLNLVVDMNGCPDRCLHCWLGHMSNRKMEEDSDIFIMNYFSPFFNKIAYYSWLREPDYCNDYVVRWEKDKAQALRVILNETSMWDLALEEYMYRKWNHESTHSHDSQEDDYYDDFDGEKDK